VWYYEQPLPEGRRQYTKTQPIQFEEFADCLMWFGDRKENDRAWKVPSKKILDNGCNLDIKNPSAKDDLKHQPPEKLVESIVTKEQKILEIMGEIKAMLAEGVK
jgi:type I restriction enzyme M protein